MTTAEDRCQAAGPAFTEEFLRADLPRHLHALREPVFGAWPALSAQWARVTPVSGPASVLRFALAPLTASLGYRRAERAETVTTRAGLELGGYRAAHPSGGELPLFAVGVATPLDTRARAGRDAPSRWASRVMAARGDGVGLLANGRELRLLIRDEVGRDSHLSFPLERWRDAPAAPEDLTILGTLAHPKGIAALPALLRAARLAQTRVTATLRERAQDGLVAFLRHVAERPGNVIGDPAELWHDGLILVHRLLFLLKLESRVAAAGFTASALWRRALSPGYALGPLVCRRLDHGIGTGTMLEDGLRAAFRAVETGLETSDVVIPALGGALFGAAAMPVLDRLRWGEAAVAALLDHLLWTGPGARGQDRARLRVDYAALDVEVLGGVYESLLGLEAGIAARDSVRLRRGNREVVVPGDASAATGGAVVERIPAGRFHVHHGAARKSGGAYYTPAEFVRLLVTEALEPARARALAPDDPDPGVILSLRVIDPACGSGHFLVEACRFLGEALFEACRACLGKSRGLEGQEAARFHDRLGALPDPDGLLLGWLDADAPGGIAEARARALCRRMVAIHCLYGVDRNPMAVALARLSLWLEAHAEGLPLTFLDHRLRVGDSLTGPRFTDLARLPVGGGALDPLLARGIAAALADRMVTIRRDTALIGATLGRDLADLGLKQAAGARMAAAIAPLMALAETWAGAVIRPEPGADDEWLALAREVAETGAWPVRLTPRQTRLHAAGAGALCWDLAFPDVDGFDAVLGNPPWEVVQPNQRDFAARFDLRVLDAVAPGERAARIGPVMARAEVAAAYDAYRAEIAGLKRVSDRLYLYQRAGDGVAATAGNLDTYRLFAEAAARIVAPSGVIALLLPSAFHANDGASAIRGLYLDRGLETCLSFENRAGVFDIDGRFKFAAVIARGGRRAASVRCGFYLDSIAAARDPGRVMAYDHGFIAASGGTRRTLIELRGEADFHLARRLFALPERFALWCSARGIRFGRELHMTGDAHWFRSTGADGLILHEGKTFHQYTDVWEAAPRHRVPPAALAERAALARNTGHFRMAFRDIARSNDARSAIATMMRPGVVLGHTATVERTPERRAIADALALCGVFNSLSFDWLARRKTTAHLSLYLLADLPMPTLSASVVAGLARRVAGLCEAAEGFAALRAMMGNVAPISLVAERAAARAWIDATVALAYGLSEAEYEHVLAGFTHKDDPGFPALCRAAFRSGG
jgi:hypothetical protein